MATFWAVIYIDSVDRDGNTIIDLQDSTTTITSTISCGDSVPSTIAATLSDPNGLLATSASCRYPHSTNSALPTNSAGVTVPVKTKSSAGPIAAGVIVPILAIAAIVGAWFWCRKRARRATNHPDEYEYTEHAKPARTFSEAGYRDSEGLQALSAFPNIPVPIIGEAAIKRGFTARSLPVADSKAELEAPLTTTRETVDLPEVLHELEDRKNPIEDGRSPIEDRGSPIGAPQPSDLPEVVDIEDDEIRRLHEERARLNDRRSRLEELERLQAEEDRINQQLEERRALLRTR